MGKQKITGEESKAKKVAKTVKTIVFLFAVFAVAKTASFRLCFQMAESHLFRMCKFNRGGAPIQGRPRGVSVEFLCFFCDISGKFRAPLSKKQQNSSTQS